MRLFPFISNQLGMNSWKRFFRKKTVNQELPEDPAERPGRGDLLDLFIHDMRGPLSVASVSLQRLLQKGDKNALLSETQRSVLERVLRNTQKAQNLLQEMIEIFRCESKVFRRELFHPETVLREALLDILEVNPDNEGEEVCRSESMENFKQLMAGQGIFFEISGRHRELPFAHDPRKVRQILRNLISNALKYRRRRLLITIQGDEDLVMTVEDDGPGIPPEGQKKIFERFIRLSNQKADQIPGLGLGLSGVKTLVEAMGGEITFMSREGSGCRFTVRIPPLANRPDED